MIRVNKIDDNTYKVFKNNKLILEGSALKTIRLLRDYSISFEEIEYGLMELIKNDHAIAEYGIGLSDGKPKFIFSK